MSAVWVPAWRTGSITSPCSTTYRLFKLGSCRPSQAASTVSSVEDLSAGKIEVKIDQVINTGRQQQCLNVQAAAPSRTAADKKLPEGKKVRDGQGGARAPCRVAGSYPAPLECAQLPCVGRVAAWQPSCLTGCSRQNPAVRC